MALRNVIRLSSLDVVYSVFDEILSVWMDDISAMSTPGKVSFLSLSLLPFCSSRSRFLIHLVFSTLLPARSLQVPPSTLQPKQELSHPESDEHRVDVGRAWRV